MVANSLSVAPIRMWSNSNDPGVSEPSVEQGNWFLNSSSNALFICQTPTLGAQVWNKFALPAAASPLGATLGGTGVSNPTANCLQVGNGSSALTQLATANNGVLITSGGGVPSISSTLPSAVQGNITSVGTIASGIWNGTTLAVTSGGTGLSSTTANQLLYSSGTSVIAGLATANNGVLITSGAGIPSVSSTLPAAVQANITALGALTSLTTAPAASQASSLSLGSAYQNTFGYDVMLIIYLNVTVNAGGNVLLGVGPTNTPTQQTLITGLTVLGFLPITIYLPKSYYALLSATLTATIIGQQAMPI